MIEVCQRPNKRQKESHTRDGRGAELALHEGEVEVAFRRRQRPALRVAAQADASVQDGGRAVRVDDAAAGEAAVGVIAAGRRQERGGQVLPVHQVAADRVAPDDAEGPFAGLCQVLVEPTVRKKRRQAISLHLEGSIATERHSVALNSKSDWPTEVHHAKQCSPSL